MVLKNMDIRALASEKLILLLKCVQTQKWKIQLFYLFSNPSLFKVCASKSVYYTCTFTLQKDTDLLAHTLLSSLTKFCCFVRLRMRVFSSGSVNPIQLSGGVNPKEDELDELMFIHKD